MAYPAIAVPVMIASPSDVDDERKAAREIMYGWNDLHSETMGIILVPVGWETHSFPEMGERPQGLINKRVLKNCDLLIGIFWTRIGSPTGKSESGTVEEIEEHLKASKPAMLYFSSKPANPDSIESEQLARVRAFREKIMTMGLIQKYDTLADFKEKFRIELTRHIVNTPYFNKLRRPSGGAVEQGQYASETASRSLSTEATKLLKAASLGDGEIFIMSFDQGTDIRAGTEDIPISSPRDKAKWMAGLNELVERHLIGRVSDSLFELTKDGWTTADSLEV